MKPKILLWDLETTNLNADFGIILCVGYKWFGERKVNVIRVDESKGYNKNRMDDAYPVREFLKVLAEADIQITWYGKRFDEPFLKSRMLYHGMDLQNPPPVPHIDGWEIARKELKLSSNRLASVQDFLDLDEKKTPLRGRIWFRAAGGDKDALDEIVKHCVQDIKVLELAYERLRPLMRVNRPNMGVQVDKTQACPACGSEKLQRRGHRLTLTQKFQRFQCMECGAWSSAPKGKVPR